MWPFGSQKPEQRRVNRSAVIYHRADTGQKKADWMSSLVPMVPLAAQIVLQKADRMLPQYRKALEEVVNEPGIRNQVFEFLNSKEWVQSWTAKQDFVSQAYDALQVTGETMDIVRPSGAASAGRPALDRKIRLNIDTATFGTLVHELLHYCCTKDFGKDAKEFAVKLAGGDKPRTLETFRRIAEGPTEFYTRRLLRDGGNVDARHSYATEYQAVESAMTQKVLTEDLLDKAYFGGDEKAFEEVAHVLHMGGLGHGMGDVLTRGARAGRGGVSAAAAAAAAAATSPSGQ